MPKFTHNLLKGMGALAITPRMVRVWAFPTVKLLYTAKVSIPGRFQSELVGTELFSADPTAADWQAVGNDMRMGFIRYIEESADGERKQGKKNRRPVTSVAVHD